MSTTGPPSITATAPTSGAGAPASARAACACSDSAVAAWAADGNSATRHATTKPPPTRRTTCVSTPRAPVLRGLLHQVFADVVAGGDDLLACPAVVGLTRRRAHHLLDQHQPAGDLVAGDQRPAVLGELLERRSRAFPGLDDGG